MELMTRKTPNIYHLVFYESICEGNDCLLAHKDNEIVDCHANSMHVGSPYCADLSFRLISGLEGNHLLISTNWNKIEPLCGRSNVVLRCAADVVDRILNWAAG